MIYRILIVIMAGIVLITGCTGGQSLTQVGSTELALTTPSQLATHTPAYTVSPEPFQTLVSVTPSMTLTSTPTPRPKPNIIENCLTILPGIPDQQVYPGTLALETHLPGSTNPIHFLILATGEKAEIGGDKLDLSVSPDHTMYAYEDYDSKRLEIFNSKGERIRSLAWGKYWGNISVWLDNQNLLILMADPDPKYSNQLKYPPDMTRVNLLNNKLDHLSSDYPDIDYGSLFCPWGRFGCTIYNPNLTRVIYPGVTSNGDKNDEVRYGAYILLGIPDEIKMADVTNQSWFNHPPVWSPDGSQFIMMGDTDFYLVSYDGAVKQITHMNPSFDLTTVTGLEYLAEYYSWSPDGQHVALWLEELSTKQRTLAILDTHSGLIIDTCIKAGYDPMFIRTEPYPVWSPDGKSVAFSANYRPEDYSNDVVLLDLEAWKAFKIGNNLFPVGWLIEP